MFLLLASLMTAPTTEIRAAFEFERIKLRDSYASDLAKATKQGQLFFLWVDHEDIPFFADLLEEYPDSIHSYVEKLPGYYSPGVIVGRTNGDAVEQIKVISASDTRTLKAKGVILTTSP